MSEIENDLYLSSKSFNGKAYEVRIDVWQDFLQYKSFRQATLIDEFYERCIKYYAVKRDLIAADKANLLFCLIQTEKNRNVLEEHYDLEAMDLLRTRLTNECSPAMSWAKSHLGLTWTQGDIREAWAPDFIANGPSSIEYLIDKASLDIAQKKIEEAINFIGTAGGVESVIGEKESGYQLLAQYAHILSSVGKYAESNQIINRLVDQDQAQIYSIASFNKIVFPQSKIDIEFKNVFQISLDTERERISLLIAYNRISYLASGPLLRKHVEYYLESISSENPWSYHQTSKWFFESLSIVCLNPDLISQFLLKYLNAQRLPRHFIRGLARIIAETDFGGSLRALATENSELNDRKTLSIGSILREVKASLRYMQDQNAVFDRFTVDLILQHSSRFHTALKFSLHHFIVSHLERQEIRFAWERYAPDGAKLRVDAGKAARQLSDLIYERGIMSEFMDFASEQHGNKSSFKSLDEATIRWRRYLEHVYQ